MNKMENKDCHLLPQYFKITIKNASSNSSIDPIRFSSLHNFFSHYPEYLTMAVINIQIYGVQLSGKWICKLKN